MKKTLLIPAILCLCALLLCACTAREAPPAAPPAQNLESPAPLSVASPQPAQEAPALPESPEDEAVPGTLLDSGSGLNENYYKNVSYFGAASDLTESSFILGRLGMAFDSKAQPVLNALTILYDEETLIRSAVLKDDTYELYAGSAELLPLCIENPEYTFDIILRDTDSQELWAEEIRISRFIFE